jgi:TolB protein
MAMRLRAIGTGVLSVVVVVAAFAAVALAGGSAQGTQAWAAGNNGLIAFVGGKGVSVMRADGSGVRLLRRADALIDLAWAPDGRRLAFVTRGAIGSAIWVMDADGSDAVRLTARSRKASDDLWAGLLSPTWSPDGRLIAYSDGVRDRDRDVWVMNADGTSTRRLARTVDCAELDVDWSPKGDQLVTNCVWGWAARDLRLINADGSAVTSLLGHKRSASAWEPDWSPDGRRIAFARSFPGPMQRGLEIYLVSAAGGSPVRLAPHRKKTMDDRDPTWSPDGRRIAFTRASFRVEDGVTYSQQPAGVYVMNADGTGVTRLTTCPGSSCWGRSPAWQPSPQAP